MFRHFVVMCLEHMTAKDQMVNVLGFAGLYTVAVSFVWFFTIF